jgi:membrane associated rhomboid family serine protease
MPMRNDLEKRIVPGVNYALIALNLGIFMLEWTASDSGAHPEVIERWALIPSQLVAHPLANLWMLITHMFLHASVSHVAGNMLYLWVFGGGVEDALGHWRYLVFYLLCGFAAALCQVAASPSSSVAMLGASGAISGVLAGFAVLYPTAPIGVINPIPILWLFWGLFIFLPAWLVIAVFFLVNLWNALQPQNPAGGVAFVAHVGGFIAGLVLIHLLRVREPVEYDRGYRTLRRVRAS